MLIGNLHQESACVSYEFPESPGVRTSRLAGLPKNRSPERPCLLLARSWCDRQTSIVLMKSVSPRVGLGGIEASVSKLAHGDPTLAWSVLGTLALPRGGTNLIGPR